MRHAADAVARAGLERGEPRPRAEEAEQASGVDDAGKRYAKTEDGDEGGDGDRSRGTTSQRSGAEPGHGAEHDGDIGRLQPGGCRRDDADLDRASSAQ